MNNPIVDNPCPECKTGEVVCYTKPDGNFFCCDNCGYIPKIGKP